MSTPVIQIRNLSLRLGEFALHDASLDVVEGEYFVFLGPTGAGKTVVLECLAGLFRPQAGTVTIAGEAVGDIPPERRGIGYLPQDYALFPHLSVAENIAFGMRLRRKSTQEITQSINELSSMLGVSHLLRRSPVHLSGGEKQRVALARALAINPSVLLLDEPLSAVDEQTREELCVELRHVHQRLNTTTVHVSHNFEETLAVADRVGIIHEGRIQQIGTPDDLFRRPQSEFVARFMRCQNLLRARARRQGDHLLLETGGGQFAAAMGPEGEVRFIVRPEDVELARVGQQGGTNHLHGRIRNVVNRGPMFRVDVQGDIGLVALVGRRSFERSGLQVGDSIGVTFDPESVHVFSADATGVQ